MARSSQAEERFDSLAAQINDWVDSAVALDEGHFPNELLSDLQDLTEDLKTFLEEEGTDYDRREVTEIFITPEMGEVVDRFPRVRRLIESAWGSRLIDEIAEANENDFGTLDEDEDEDEED